MRGGLKSNRKERASNVALANQVNILRKKIIFSARKMLYFPAVFIFFSLTPTSRFPETSPPSERSSEQHQTKPPCQAPSTPPHGEPNANRQRPEWAVLLVTRRRMMCASKYRLTLWPQAHSGRGTANPLEVERPRRICCIGISANKNKTCSRRLHSRAATHQTVDQTEVLAKKKGRATSVRIIRTTPRASVDYWRPPGEYKLRPMKTYLKAAETCGFR